MPRFCANLTMLYNEADFLQAGPRHHRQGRLVQPVAAVRHLPHAGDGRRSRAHHAGEPPSHRAPAARRQPGPQRARHGRDQLPVSLRLDRPHRLHSLNIAAVGEALLFASKAGADPARVRQALMGGFAASRILEVHGERMVKRTFQPGFRIELNQKDLNLALSGARALGLALPQTAGAAQLMQACAAHGMAGLDHSALVRALEVMAKHQVAPDPSA